MDVILVYGFTAAVIGGLDSPVGALVGGLVTGLALSYVGGYLGAQLEPSPPWPCSSSSLMIRPEGLFSRPAATAGLMSRLRRATPGRSPRSRGSGCPASHCCATSSSPRLAAVFSTS